jgi:peptidoglycan/LPS O-acetylase OafA/YrhL
MRSSTSHRSDLQGLRAVAVLLVVLNHAGVSVLPGGFVGVDVFFVLSGFLITGLLLAEARDNGSVSLVNFYVRRARRILPAAALTLLVTDLAACFLLNFLRAKDAVHDSIYAAAFAANFRFAARGADYFAQSQPPSPLLHFWSLAVEEQFYLVWPALLSLVLVGVALARRGRPTWRRQRRCLLLVVALLAALSLGWSVYLTKALPPAAYFSPLTRAWELGLGAALAIGASTLTRVPPLARLFMGWAGLLAIAIAATVFSSRTPFPGSAALLPTIGAALVICAGLGARPPRLAAGRVLALRPMRVVGDRSYAFYLWHWPVLILAAQYVGHDLSLNVKLGLLAAAFLLSCVSYALVENPIRRASLSPAATVLVFGTCMAALLGAAALSIAALDREQQRFDAREASGPVVVPAQMVASYRSVPRAGAPRVLSEVVAAVRAARRGERIPSGLTPPIEKLRDVPFQYAPPRGCIPQATSSRPPSKVCRLGRTTSRRLLILIGDSHAEMWLPAVLRMAWRDGWVVVPLIRPGCMPGTWITDRGLPACRPWYRWATRQARLLHPRVTLVGGAVSERWAPAAGVAVDGMISMARAVKPASGTVVVIGDPEGLRDNPIDCLLSRHASMATCTTTWPPGALRPYDRLAALARHQGFPFLDTRGWLCFERRCPPVIGHTIAYKDSNHLTAAYSIHIAGPFRSAFLRATPHRRPGS